MPKKKFDLKKDRNLIIHQVLAYGTMDQVRDLFKIYGRNKVKQEFKKPYQGLYYPSILEFFCFIFRIRHIDKSRYLKDI